jgi:class 3 adenylate cyclase/tetratricopeptide (TPR) repeat protein
VGIPETAVVEAGRLAPYLPRLTIEWLRADATARRRALEGTLAFVDISGFTAMSERLAPKGKRGAEEVIDVMSATFARLLGVAYENGGGLVKLGGDAMLLFFDGEDHARRACAASWGMRDSLRALGPLQTSVGPVALQMHVGVHTGAFDFFLVGNRHRELIVAGAAAARTVEMEETAAAGEIAVSDATASLLETPSLGERKGSGTLLAAPPAVALTGIPVVPAAAEEELLPFVPEALRDSLLAEKLESEHRHAAVAFARFGGVDDLHDAEGIDAVAAAIAEVVDALEEAAAAYNVCFLESDIDAFGGRVVLVSGVPTTRGDDEERLLRAIRAAVEAETRLPLHIGVATGNVFAGNVGPSYRRAYTILGGTAALAARLMAKAEPRSVWTTPEVLARSKTTFATTPVGALTLKGKSAPVEAVAVGPVAGARTAARKKLPLVDRQRELPMLDALLVPVKMGFGNVVELIGDAGIGKSRIVEELCDRAGDLTLVSAACEQYEAGTPYFPFTKLLQGLLGVTPGADALENSDLLTERLTEIDRELVPWMPLVADVLDLPVEPTQETEDLQPSFRRARLNGVVESLLATLLATPTLLLFEDVHWMDEASSDLLRHLGSHAQTKPWLVCSTRRPGGGGFVAAEATPPVPALSLRLDPLPVADAEQLAAAAAESDLAPDQLAAITERAGGNPLFVQELVAASRAETEVEALPESVEGVVTSRIDSLSPADRALLRWASVLGATFSGELVARVLEGDPAAELDSESWDRLADFVERDPYAAGHFHFRHALIRDAAYEGLSYRRRRELHARVADVIAQTAEDEDEVAETLSVHYSLAERPAETWTYSLRAARRARAKHANTDAAEFYRRALDATHSLPSVSRGDVGRAWEELGDVYELTADYAEARLAYKQARTLLRGDGDALAELYLKEGRLREREGYYTDALRWYARGLRAAQSLDDPALETQHRLRLSVGYAAARFRQGAMRDCVEWCEKAAEEAKRTGALAELAHAYHILHLAYTSLGSPERTRVRDLAIPIYEELGELPRLASAVNNLGIDAYYEGRWDDALAHYERSRELHERIGDSVGAAMATNNIAEIYSDQGRIAAAEQLFVHVREVCERAGERILLALAIGNLGRAASRAGRFEDARSLLDAAFIASHEAGAASFAFEMHARLAELAILAGRPDAALTAADAAEDLDGGASTPSVRALLHRVRAYAHAMRGEHDEADAEIERSLEVARGSDAIYEVALSVLARGQVKNDEAATAEARTLLEALDVVDVAVPKL